MEYVLCKLAHKYIADTEDEAMSVPSKWTNQFVNSWMKEVAEDAQQRTQERREANAFGRLVHNQRFKSTRQVMQYIIDLENEKQLPAYARHRQAKRANVTSESPELQTRQQRQKSQRGTITDELQQQLIQLNEQLNECRIQGIECKWQDPSERDYETVIRDLIERLSACARLNSEYFQHIDKAVRRLAQKEQDGEAQKKTLT